MLLIIFLIYVSGELNTDINKGLVKLRVHNTGIVSYKLLLNQIYVKSVRKIL